MRRRQTIAWAVAAVVLCAVIGVVAAVRRTTPAATNDGVPTGRVKRGDLDLRVFTTGEVHATHSMMVTAPAIGGGNLKITRLLHTGSLVKKGDIVVEFDPSEQQFKVEQSRSELLQAEQEIIKAHADAAVQTAQDKVALLKARYDVRRAELEVQKNELVSTIDAKKNDLSLEQTKRALAELEQDIKSHNASGEATISLAEEKRNKAKLGMDTAQQSIDKMRIPAPMDGLIALQKNTTATEFFFTGMTLPEYREGDQVEAGGALCQVIDPKEMELVAKVGELERSNVKAGQAVNIELDALPGSVFHGTVKNVAGVSSHMFWEDNTGGQYEVTIQIAAPDPRLRPGFTAQVEVLGDERKNVLYVPRQALFLKDGKRVVYVRSGSGFESREVKIQSENESRAALEGLSEGTEVALADPTAPRKTSGSSAGASGGTL
jgi:HlyD family secretion protein